MKNRHRNLARATSLVLAPLVLGGALAVFLRRKDDLRGRVGVVCGGSRGLGRSIALELARKGVNVAICARTAGDLDRTKHELEATGVRVIADVCDLRDEAATVAFLERVAAELGAIDILVANAATIGVGPVEERTSRAFKDAMASIFDTALHASLAVLPKMQARRRGTIAFVTSIGGKVGVPHLAPYSTAKFAEVGFAEALRAEVAKDGVHVLTVVPGLMRTGSPLRATFGGDAEKELTWFSAGAIAPLMSIDADRAARKIVRAIARRDREIVFTIPAIIAARTHDVVPSLYALFFGIAGRLLPRSRGDAFTRGQEVVDRSSSPVVGAVGRANRTLAEEHGQFPPRA